MYGFQEEWIHVAKDFRSYFSRYGGWCSVITSPFTGVAFVVSLLCMGTWIQGSWFELPLQILPNLLGFTLTAFAMLLGFGDDRFREILAQSAENEPLHKSNILLTTSAIFFHFIFIQVIALLFAVVGHAHPLRCLEEISPLGMRNFFHNPFLHGIRHVFAGLGFTFFVLSLSNALAAALNVFHITNWYVDFLSHEEHSRDITPPSP